MAVPDDFFGELYNGKLIERNRAIRYSHETRHPLQVQYDREHGIRGNLAPGVTCGRRVDHLTPEEREFADYYEIGFEHLQQPQGQEMVAGTLRNLTLSV